MSKQQKPVWRVNSGNGVPSDLGGFVLYEEAAKSEKVQGYHFNHNDKWLIKNYMDISAYQTTRTKAAKYKSTICRQCQGRGWWYSRISFTPFGQKPSKPNGRQCDNCNGKGYTLEAIK